MASAAIPFKKEMSFEYGQAQNVAPGVRRVVAENPSAFTHFGTNTYIVGSGEVAVIDPGPEIAEHVDNISAALAGETVTQIIVTHTHVDHSPASSWLKELTSAPIVGAYPQPQASGETVEAAQKDFEPDEVISDGSLISGPNWDLRAVYTPGHMSNHYCFALEDLNILFSGDHVMGWNTTIVSPPDGNMRDYLQSLRLCLGRAETLYLPGHGPEIRNTHSFVRSYLNHRLMREDEIENCIANGVNTITGIVKSMYTHLPTKMHAAAARSVLAHIEHMADTGRVKHEGSIGHDTVFFPGETDQ